MKKIITIVGLCMLFLIVGCSDENNPTIDNRHLSLTESKEFCESKNYQWCGSSYNKITCGDGGCFSDSDTYKYTNPPEIILGDKFMYD